MNSKQQRKNQARKCLVHTRRKDRLISEYIRHKYPEIYNEAVDTHEKLDAMYPQKRDLTKSMEFMQMTNGVLTYNQYYYHRKTPKARVEKLSKMGLTIPLMSASDVQEQATLEIPGAADVIVEVCQDPNLREVFREMTCEPDNVQHEGPPNNTQHEAVQHEVASDNVQQEVVVATTETYKSMVDDLVNDPELASVFDDFDFSLLSPLETELNNSFNK